MTKRVTEIAVERVQLVEEPAGRTGLHVTLRGGNRQMLQQAVRGYLQRWHPAGYSTRFGEIEDDGTGGLQLRGHRFRSCD